MTKQLFLTLLIAALACIVVAVVPVAVTTVAAYCLIFFVVMRVTEKLVS